MLDLSEAAEPPHRYFAFVHDTDTEVWFPQRRHGFTHFVQLWKLKQNVGVANDMALLPKDLHKESFVVIGAN